MKILRNILLIGTTVALFFLIGEIFFRLIYVDPSLRYEADKDLYWIFKPNQTGSVLMGGGSFWSPKAHINSAGFRGEETRLAINEKQIIFIGDSLTFGVGVADEDVISEQLSRILIQNKIDKIEVVNAAMPGWGIFQMQRIFEKRIKKLDPEILILIYSEGDEVRQPFKDNRVEEKYFRDSILRHRVRDMSIFATWVQRKLDVVTLQFNRVSTKNSRRLLSAANREMLIDQDLTRILQVVNESRNLGINFLLVAWLQENQSLFVEGKKDSPIFVEKIKAFEKRYNVPVLLLGSSIFPDKYSKYELVIKGDGHPTALAHELAAKAVYKTIDDLGWLSHHN